MSRISSSRHARSAFFVGVQAEQVAGRGLAHSHAGLEGCLVASFSARIRISLGGAAGVDRGGLGHAPHRRAMMRSRSASSSMASVLTGVRHQKICRSPFVS